MQASVEGFQSIHKTKLDLTGFTVITGPSNRGKSAFIRALAAVMFGQPGDGYVKTGESKCVVELRGEDFELKWMKPRSGSATMGVTQAGGTTHYSKLGKEHQIITEKLGFKELRAGTVRLRPQVAGQGEPYFLLSLTETTLAEVLKKLGRVDVVTEAQRRVKFDGKKEQSKLEVREQDTIKARADLEKLKGVKTLREDWRKVLVQVNEWTVQGEQLEWLQSKIRELEYRVPVEIPKLITVEIPKEYQLWERVRRAMELKASTIPEELHIPDIRHWDWLIKKRQKVKQSIFLQQEIREVKEQIRQLDIVEVLCDTEKLTLEQELGVCPTCGNSF